MASFADHPFSRENISRESGASDARERNWLRWVRRAEALLGHSLDGDDVAASGCGYSLDEAGEAFDNGLTPQAYVTMVTNRERYRASRVEA